MPHFGFYRRAFFVGLIVGLASVILLPYLGVSGFIGVLAAHKETIGYLSLTLGFTAMGSFWAIGYNFWFQKKILAYVLLRLTISVMTTSIWMTEMWFVARKVFSEPLGLALDELVLLVLAITALTYFTIGVVHLLVPDRTPERLNKS